MSYAVKTVKSFDRQLARIARKYPKILDTFSSLIDELKKDPRLGDALGKHCYKIRLSIPGKPAGKSGGGRVITFVKFDQETVYLLAIYDKSKQSTISESRLLSLLDQIR